MRDRQNCIQTAEKTNILCARGSSSAAGLLSGNRQVDIRMHSHRILQLHNNKSSASCQRALMQVDCQDLLFTSLIQVVLTTGSNSANIKLHHVLSSQT